jgi:hypothetical protein
MLTDSARRFGETPLSSANIDRLINCTTLDGNLIIIERDLKGGRQLDPIRYTGKRDVMITTPDYSNKPIVLRALAETELYEKLHTLRVISGHVYVQSDGEYFKPITLKFLANLEEIEGRAKHGLVVS